MGNYNVLEKETILKGLRLAIIISLLISALIILFTIDLKSLIKVIINIDTKYILILLLVIFMNWFFGGLRLKILISTIGGDISLKDGIIVYLAGAFISNVTPFASGGGPFQIYFLHKKGVNVGKSSTVIVTQFILRLFFFGLITPIFLIFFNWAISPGIIPDYLFYLAFGFGIFVSVGIIVLILIPKITDSLLNSLLSITKIKEFIKNNQKAKRWLVKGKIELKEFRYSLETMTQFKKRLFLAGLCTAAFWSSLFLIAPLTLKGLGVEPNFVRTFVMQTIFYMIIPYMPSPGASGIAELGFASLFAAFVPQKLIGLVAFTWRFYTFYLVLLIGGFIALREINRNRSNLDG